MKTKLTRKCITLALAAVMALMLVVLPAQAQTEIIELSGDIYTQIQGMFDNWSGREVRYWGTSEISGAGARTRFTSSVQNANRALIIRNGNFGTLILSPTPIERVPLNFDVYVDSRSAEKGAPSTYHLVTTQPHEWSMPVSEVWVANANNMTGYMINFSTSTVSGHSDSFARISGAEHQGHPIHYESNYLLVPAFDADAFARQLGITPPTTPAAQPVPVSDITITIEGVVQSFEVPPQIIDGRTMLPLRAICDAIGGLDVDFDGATNTATITTRETGVVATHVIGTSQITVNYGHGTADHVRDFDAASTVIDGRTLVPVRMIAEVTGMGIDWDNDTRTVTIFYTGP